MTGKPPSPASAPVARTDFAEAHRELLADRSIQFDLKMYEPPSPAAQADPPGWLTSLVEWLAQEHPLLRLLVYALFAAAILLILWLIVRSVRRSAWWYRLWSSEEDASGQQDWRPGEAPARALLGEADALAAQGRFSEAAHLLLFRSIEDIEDRHPDLLRPALTSRDISALPAIPERPRSAFATIAMMVEQSLFARRDLGEGDWRDCREAYERFAFAESWA